MMEKNLYDDIKNKENKFIDDEENENKKDIKNYYFKISLSEKIKYKYSKKKFISDSLLIVGKKL